MKEGTLAIATLLYSPDYLPGVFTLITQLNRLLDSAKEKHPTFNLRTCLLVTPDLFNDALTDLSREILTRSFTDIIQIEPLSNQALPQEQNKYNLHLLQRPELSFALIKARLWEQTQFDQILYLDADTLPLNDTLFDVFQIMSQQKRNQIGASVDIGWPDMFNSGVMTIIPDLNIFQSLQDFILNEKSIDGADQGILNQFFNPMCGMLPNGHLDNQWIQLPFLYNVTTPNDGYQCQPAMNFFKDQIKLIHFIGKLKPWKKWTMNEFKDNEYTNIWHSIYNDFAQDNGMAPSLEPKPEEPQHHEEYYLPPTPQQQQNEEYHEHHEEHHEEYHEEYHEPQQQQHNEEQNQDNSNLNPYVHQEGIKEMEENAIKQKQQEEQLQREIEEQKQKELESQPIPLPLDFKEWLTTFVEGDNHHHEQEQHVEDHYQEPPHEEPAHEEQHYEEPHFEEPAHEEQHYEEQHHEEPCEQHHEEPQPEDIQVEPIVDHEIQVESHPEPVPEPEPEPEPVPVYKFAWEETNYLQKVERIFPGEVFAYETKPEELLDSDDENNVDAPKQDFISKAQNREKLSSKSTTTTTNDTKGPKISKEEKKINECGSDKQIDDEDNEESSRITIKEKKKNHERKKSIRERLKEMTDNIDFGLQDYIDIGGDEDNDANLEGISPSPPLKVSGTTTNEPEYDADTSSEGDVVTGTN